MPNRIRSYTPLGRKHHWRYYATASTWITTRLDAWRDTDGKILRGYYQDRGRRTAIYKAIVERHGRQALTVLESGGPAADGLTAAKVAEFGRRAAERLRRQHDLIATKTAERARAAAERAVAADARTRQQTKQDYLASVAQRQARAAADRHTHIVASHQAELEKARAELTANTRPDAADVVPMAEWEALTPGERYQRARAGLSRRRHRNRT